MDSLSIFLAVLAFIVIFAAAATIAGNLRRGPRRRGGSDGFLPVNFDEPNPDSHHPPHDSQPHAHHSHHAHGSHHHHHQPDVSHHPTPPADTGGHHGGGFDGGGLHGGGHH